MILCFWADVWKLSIVNNVSLKGTCFFSWSETTSDLGPSQNPFSSRSFSALVCGQLCNSARVSDHCLTLQPHWKGLGLPRRLHPRGPWEQHTSRTLVSRSWSYAVKSRRVFITHPWLFIYSDAELPKLLRRSGMEDVVKIRREQKASFAPIALASTLFPSTRFPRTFNKNINEWMVD